MICVITFLLILLTATKNPLNYQFDYLKTIDIRPIIGNQSLSNIYYPCKDMILAKTVSSIRLINPNELYFNSSIPINSSQSIFFGSERTIVYDSSSAFGINSYYKPTISFSNLLSKTARMRTITTFQNKFWIFNTLNTYIQQYSKQNGIMNIFTGSLPRSQQLLFTVDLKYDQLLVYQNYVYLYNQTSTSSSKYSMISDGNFMEDLQCFKTLEQRSQDNTKINQFLGMKSGQVIIIYQRTIQLSQQGVITYISPFTEFNRFRDLSYSCNFNIKNSSIISIFTSRSTAIQRSLNIPDQFIGVKNSSPGKNSVKVYNRHNIFYNSTHRFTLNTQNYQINVQTINANISAFNKMKKVFQFMSYILYYADNTITLTNKQSGFTKIFQNVSNCSLIGDILYIIRERPQKTIQISTFNIPKMQASQTPFSIDFSKIQNYDFKEVDINSTVKGLMIIRQLQDSTIKKSIIIYDYNKQQASILDGYNHSSESINIICLSYIPTIYAEIIQTSDEKLNFKFYTLNHTFIGSQNVPAYQSIKILDNAFIVFYANHSDSLIFYYQIKGDKIQFPISEQKLQFSKLSSQIQSNNILLFKDTHIQGNYIVYAYIPQKTALIYNTINPIKNERKLKYYSFSSDSQLLIKPQTFGNNVYYVFKNFTFVHLKFEEVSNDNAFISQLSKDFSQFLENCEKVSMKITPLKKIQTKISFICVTKRNNNYILYSAISEALNPTKTILQVKGTVQDHTFNQDGETGVTTQIGGYSYLYYYQSIIGYQTINYNISKFKCFSNNGQNVVLSNGVGSSLVVNLQTGKSYTILSQISTCAISDKGSEVIHYKQGVVYVFIQGQLWHKFKQQKDILKILFLGDEIHLSSSSQRISYKDIHQIKQGNVNLIQNYYDQYSNNIFSINGNILLYFQRGMLTYRGIYICLMDNYCYNPVTFQQRMNEDLIRVTSQGDLAVLKQNEPAKLMIYTPSLKSCQSDQYRANGQCQQCFDHCNSCEQETGFCNQCASYSGWFWTLSSIIVVLAIVIFLMHKYRKHQQDKKKRKKQPKKKTKKNPRIDQDQQQKYDSLLQKQCLQSTKSSIQKSEILAQNFERQRRSNIL